MAKIEKTIKHHMSLEDAKSKASGLIDMLESKYPSIIDTIEWNDDKTAASLKGKVFKGDFNINDEDLAIKIELGFLASPFKGKIESELEEQLKDFKA